MQHRRDMPEVIHDDDRNPYIAGQVRQQNFIGIEAAGRPADADHRERRRGRHRFKTPSPAPAKLLSWLPPRRKDRACNGSYGRAIDVTTCGIYLHPNATQKP
jgi:hypothetical protein